MVPSLKYTDTIAQLVSPEALSGFPAPHQPSGMRDRIEQVAVEWLKDDGIENLNAAKACVSGLWLLHNYLDESHEISQSLSTAEGSWWHAIMHRLEGDFGNSKYWYRSTGDHPAFKVIAEELGLNSPWSPSLFVDRCQAGSSGH